MGPSPKTAPNFCASREPEPLGVERSGRMRSRIFWSRIVLAGLGAVALSLAAIAQQPPSAVRGYAPPGRLVDVGGRRLHLYATGKGGPTVVLEAGAGDF